MRAVAALLALALGAAAAHAAEAPATLTMAQVRAMSPEALTRRLFGDLSQIMLPVADPERLENGPLAALHFLTRARRTEAAGICETDFVTVGFELLGPRTADSPARPRQFIIYPIYFVSDLARARRTDQDAYQERLALDAACAAIDPGAGI